MHSELASAGEAGTCLTGDVHAENKQQPNSHSTAAQLAAR